MKENEYMVRCPLIKDEEIEEYTCFEIHTVVQGTSPAFVAPKEIFDNKNYIEICNNCKYHRED